MSTIFISHSSKDNAIAVDLKERLEAQGHRSVFLDLDPDAGIQAGVSWERTLYTKLRACRAVVAIVTDTYLASQWCFAEIALARMEGKQLFVLLADPLDPTRELPSILTEEQFMDLREDPEDAYHRLWNGFRIKGITPQTHREWGPADPPYPGLRAFEERDAPIFFGRDEEIRAGVELLNQVRRQGFPRLVMVLGASGSGKSSLARAGLLPALRRDEHEWFVVDPFRPGADPVRELAAVLSRAFRGVGVEHSIDSLHESLARFGDAGSRGDRTSTGAAAKTSVPRPAVAATTLGQTRARPDAARERMIEAIEAIEAEVSLADDSISESVRRIKAFLQRSSPEASRPRDAEPLPTSANPLIGLARELRLRAGTDTPSVTLMVDQFEELLGYEGEADHPANRFLVLLRDALEADDSPLVVVGTMRSDYLGSFQRSPPLVGIGFKSLSVGPMSREGMRDVIERPAELGQIQLEAGLTDRLLHDTGTPDALPLLAFVLQIMWSRYREDRLLEVREYEDLGGLQGAIASVADETLEAALADGDVTDLRNVFLRLARPTEVGGGWVRQPLRWDQIDPAVRPMIQRFVDQRLLVRRENDTVEVAHEALFRSWTRLRRWLAENAEGLRLLQEIRAEATRWDAAETQDEKDSYLWRGGRLAHALDLKASGVLVLEELDERFVDASEQAERALVEAEAARQRQEREILEKLAEEQRERAEEQTRSAARLRRQLLVVRIAGGIAAVALVAALYQMVQATRQSSIAQAAGATALLSSNPTEGLVEAIGAVHASRWLQWVPGGVPHQVKDSLFGTLQALRLGRIERDAFAGHAGWVYDVAFSADGNLLASVSDDGSLLRWSPIGERVGDPFTGVDGLLPAFAASPIEDLIVALGATEEGQARLFFVRWDGTPVREAVDTELPLIWSAAFSPDGTLLAAGTMDGQVALFDRAGQFIHAFPAHEAMVIDLAFHPQGLHFATASGDGTLKAWDLEGNMQALFAGHGDVVVSVDFSPDGILLASASHDRSIRLWDTTGQQLGDPIRGHTSAVTSVRFDPAGQFLASTSEDRTIRFWNLQGRPLAPPLRGHQGPVNGVAFYPDGGVIATASSDQSVRLWDVPQVGLGHALPVLDVAIDRDGDTIVSASEDGTVRRWNDFDFRPQAEPYAGHAAPVFAVALSADGSTIVSGDAAGAIHVTDRAGIPIHAPLAQLEDGLADVAITEAGDLIAACDSAGWIHVWKSEGEPVSRFRADASAIRSIDFNTDGTELAVGGQAGGVSLWSIGGEQTGAGFQVPDKAVESVSLSADGERIVSTWDDKRVRISDRQGRLVGSPFDKHLDLARHAIFHPSDEILLSVGDDATLRVWRQDATTVGLPLYGHDDWISSVAMAVENEIAVTGSKDGSIRIWDLSNVTRGLDEWLEEACPWFLGHSISQAERASVPQEACFDLWAEAGGFEEVFEK